MATMERIPPSKPRRDQDALRETDGPEPHGEGLRSAGRGKPNPHRRAQPLHCPWYTYQRGRRISPSGERGSPTLNRFVQQSHLVQRNLPSEQSHSCLGQVFFYDTTVGFRERSSLVDPITRIPRFQQIAAADWS
jgi:hypothetical protein